jgi:predicted transposase YbfD/YdcC
VVTGDALYCQHTLCAQIRLVLRVERVVTEHGVRTRKVRDFVTSLDACWSATDLFALVRAHWRIENTVHYVRDVTLGEDASTVRSGTAPRVVAALQNTVLGPLHRRRWRNIAAALRHYAWRPVTDMLRLLGILLP